MSIYITGMVTALRCNMSSLYFPPGLRSEKNGGNRQAFLYLIKHFLFIKHWFNTGCIMVDKTDVSSPMEPAFSGGKHSKELHKQINYSL